MKDVQSLMDRIQEDYKSGKLQVPSLPEVAIKVNKYIGDPDANIASMAKVIQMDPALAAKLIQVANSAMYGGHGHAEDCRSAIARLGMTTTRNLVMSFALGNSFQIGSAIVRDISRATWCKSSDVAAISYVLAKVTVGIIPDKALLAGLVHNIGAIPILRYAAELPDLKKDREMITKVIEKLSRKLGSMVLKQWSFDEELIDIPSQVYNHNYEPDKKVSYQDIVIMAHVHSQFGKEGQAVPVLNDIASFKKMPVFTTGPDASIELIYEAKEEINMLTDMLTSAA